MKKIGIILFIFLIGLISFYFYKNKTQKPKNILTFWSIQLKPIYESQIKKNIKEFEQKHPDIKIVWIDIPIQEAQKRTLASILSSTPPDLINLNPDFSLLLAQRNALTFFEKKDLVQYDENILSKLKYNDKIYALPFYATSPVTIYNKKIYESCIGNNFIKTYDELFEISPRLKNCSINKNHIPAFVQSINENDTLAKILNKYDITTLSKKEEKENFKYIINNFSKMYKNNELPKDILSSNHREIIEKYMSNQALITITGTNFINMIKQNALDIYKDSQIAPQLVGKNKKYDIALMNLIIPKNAKNKDLALEFALKLTNKENQLELAHITNVLPVNKEALSDSYFRNCNKDLYEKARCVSVLQLKNLSEKDFGQQNKKTINELLNKTLEESILNNSNDGTLNKKINTLSKELRILQN